MIIPCNQPSVTGQPVERSEVGTTTNHNNVIPWVQKRRGHGQSLSWALQYILPYVRHFGKVELAIRLSYPQVSASTHHEACDTNRRAVAALWAMGILGMAVPLLIFAIVSAML